MSIILMTCQLSDLAYPLLACVSSSCARTNLYDPADPYDTELNIMGCHASDLAPLNIRSMGTRAAWTDYMGELHFAPHSPTPLLTFPYHAQC